MQKVNAGVHIWNELRSNDRFGFNIFPKTFILRNIHMHIRTQQVVIKK